MIPSSGVHDLSCRWVCPGSGYVQVTSPAEIATCSHEKHSCWCDIEVVNDLEEYEQLVDKSFVSGLTPAEQDRMVQLSEKLDADDAPFYTSIIERLVKSLRDLEK